MLVTRRTSDEGSTLVSVLVVAAVLSILVLTTAAIVVNTTQSLVGTRVTLQAQSAVDAGIAAQTARLRSGELPCANTSGSGLVADAGSATYTYTLVCGSGVATLTATATVGSSKAKRQAVFQVASSAVPPTAGGPGLFYTYGMNSRLNSYVFDSANSEVGIDEFSGSAGVFASTGKIECGSGSVFPGDVYTKTGDLQIDSGCVIEGNAYIGGTANVNGGTIKGSLIAPKDVKHNIAGTIGKPGGTEGNAFLGGTFTLNSGTVYGNVMAAGTGESTLGSGTINGNFSYKGSFGIWGTPATSIVKGAVKKDNTLTPQALPEIASWQDVSFTPVNATTPPAAWAAEGYKLTTVTGTACDKWSGNSADVTSVAGALSSRMIFDIRACSGNFDTNAGGANKEVKVNKDIAVVANRWYLSGTKFKSADGQPHTIFLITPDSKPTVAGPQCTSPATGSEQLNNSTVAKEIAVYMYTPCQMKFNGGSLRGQVYAGELIFGGGVTVAFAPRSIPGYDFSKNVDPWPGSGGSGSGGSGSTFTLVSTQDIPAP